MYGGQLERVTLKGAKERFHRKDLRDFNKETKHSCKESCLEEKDGCLKM